MGHRVLIIVDWYEAVKLTENVFRSVNIALVNELKVIFSSMGIDIWEVIEAAKTKPFGFMPFYPGPGFGGHCIPIDPFYLAWRARQSGTPARFVELAGEINSELPQFVIGKLADELHKRSKKSLRNAHILLLGLAYKKNLSDVRESPTFRLWELLRAQDAHVVYHDPLISKVPPTREFAHLRDIESVELSPSRLAEQDAVIICIDHDAVDYREVVCHSRLVIDTRNATKEVRGTVKNVVLA